MPSNFEASPVATSGMRSNSPAPSFFTIRTTSLERNPDSVAAII